MDDRRTTDFEAERRRLTRLAYRMMGSLTEAEDIVQDAWLRWAGVEGGIDSPPAYLTRIVTRLCLDREPAAVRQLAVRARKHVQAARPRFTVAPADADRIARAFFAAARDGDVAALSVLLTRNIEIHTDGGGKVLAFRNVIRGVERALRLFAGQRRKDAVPPTLLRVVTIDGLPGYVSLDGGGVLQTTALDIREDGIAAIYIVKNPDKLSHLAAEVDFPKRISPISPA